MVEANGAASKQENQEIQRQPDDKIDRIGDGADEIY